MSVNNLFARAAWAKSGLGDDSGGYTTVLPSGGAPSRGGPTQAPASSANSCPGCAASDYGPVAPTPPEAAYNAVYEQAAVNPFGLTAMSTLGIGGLAFLAWALLHKRRRK